MSYTPIQDWRDGINWVKWCKTHHIKLLESTDIDKNETDKGAKDNGERKKM